MCYRDGPFGKGSSFFVVWPGGGEVVDEVVGGFTTEKADYAGCGV